MPKSLHGPRIARPAGIAATVLAVMVVSAGCSARDVPISLTPSASTSTAPAKAISPTEFSQRLDKYEREHGVRIHVDALDTGNGRRVSWRGSDAGPYETTGLIASIIALERASDDELAATVTTPADEFEQEGQIAGGSLLGTIGSALQMDEVPATQVLVAWLGGDAEFRAASTSLLGSMPGTTSAESLASLLNNAIYGSLLPPDRRGVLRNLFLNSPTELATSAGTDPPWEVAGVSRHEGAGTMIEVCFLELPYRASNDAPPLVLATAITNADSPEAANAATREVARLVTRAFPPLRGSGGPTRG